MEKRLLESILEEIEKDNKITEKKLAQSLGVSERTIRRYIYKLKKREKIVLIGLGRKREWKVL